MLEEKHVIGADEKLRFWGYGEWCEEVDSVRFDHLGHDCRIYRILQSDGLNHVFGGHLCGYVVTEGRYPDWDLKNVPEELSVHGGITHAGKHPYMKEVCIGFDCGHCMDIVPSVESLVREKRSKLLKEFRLSEVESPFNPTYKNIHFVKEELKELVSQLIEWEKEQKLEKTHEIFD